MTPLDPSAFRYSRQMLLSGIGDRGQSRLLESHVLVVGAGALGCAVLDQLARAGVGHLSIIDRDIVELTNLQRQTLFDESDAAAGLPKALAARNRLTRVNSSLRIDSTIADVTPQNAHSLLSPRPTAILDCTDNLETRYLLNDLAVQNGIPLLYAGVIASRGMQLTILPGRSACLRCVFPDPGPASTRVETCDTAGVLGPAVAIAASLQAAEAIGLLAGDPDLRATHSPPGLTEFDLDAHRFRTINLAKLHSPAARAGCPCCGLRHFEFLSGQRTRPAANLCGNGTFQIHPAAPRSLALPALGSQLAPLGPVQANDFFVRLHPRQGVELTIFADARAIVRGVETEAQARALYDRYVGD